MAKKKKRKPRKKKIKVWCRYCKWFWESTDKEYATETKRGRIIAKDRRWCLTKDNYTNSTEEACERFEINNLFWCDKDSNQMYVEVCVARKKAKKEGCVRCKQGVDVERMSK